ncbi:hypothetical protein [Pontimicrobium aquaticum]|uniref:STAS/SEC14 domain-containing protein n=1 Tax=Pontimicrobium aquaticum TaxID=2565367 RepID=A0A4U0F0I3_9FLAO|nr:hypothetical protein [Pontimicrobium aquaticum]TJY37718.1 hypothetical protein E5167_00235 [Pontimicrobium aquaticum]
MNKTKNSYYHDSNASFNFPWGGLYFYEDFVISEISEGVVLGRSQFLEAMNLANDYFGIEKPYGLISNRVNSYSINLPELMPIAKKFGDLRLNAVVLHSGIGYENFEIEKRLLKFKGEVFFDLDQAVNWIIKEIRIYL